MKTLWCISSGPLFHPLVLNPGGENSWAWPHRRVPRAQSPRSEDAGTRARFPDSSTCEAVSRDQEKPSPVHPPNAGAPSSELATEGQTTDLCVPMGQEEETYQGGGGGQGRGGGGRSACSGLTTSRDANTLTQALYSRL